MKRSDGEIKAVPSKSRKQPINLERNACHCHTRAAKICGWTGIGREAPSASRQLAACNPYPVGVSWRMRADIKSSVKKRLGRIEGQVRGLSKMVDEDRYCIDVVTQISAVRAALRRVEEEILKDHVSHCVEHAIASGDKDEQRQKIAELMAVVGRAER